MPLKFVIVEQSAMAAGGHYFTYTSSVAGAAKRTGYDTTVLTNKRSTLDERSIGVRVVPVFSHTWSETESRGLTPVGEGDFASELDWAVRTLDIGHGDVVLVHTLGFVELRSLLDHFVSLSPERVHPHFHLLLRYDPQAMAHGMDSYAHQFETIRASSFLNRRIHLHSDTDRLAHEYGRLTNLPFETLPIPFAQEALKKRLGGKQLSSGRALNITYLGDARLEKGYQHLPRAVAELWNEYVRTGRVRFTVQSNPNIPGGEPGIREAQAALSEYEPDHVRLLSDPLDETNYYNTLADADIILIPYDADAYRYRSSGILIEAKAAGKPIVTTSQSWMATQVSEEGAVLFSSVEELSTALSTAIENFEDLKQGAMRAQKAALSKSSPEHYVESVMARHHSVPAAVPRPRVLIIMNGDAVALQNGSSRIFNSQVRFLNNAGYNVVALFLSKDLQQQNVDHVQWANSVVSATRDFEFERAFVGCAGGNHLHLTKFLRHRSVKSGFATISDDLDVARSYDFNIEFYDFIRFHQIDFVLLNYVTNYPLLEALNLTNVPVICETHDIQSFQKAIYGRRSVTDQDLEVEFEYLEKCSFLLSLNDSETKFMEARLPETVRTLTTGVFFDLGPGSLNSCAGVKDLAELVSTTRPRAIEYQFEAAWQSGRTSEVYRLFATSSVDLLFVSSAHVANVSGLRWFFTEIYEPFLRQHGISVFVAGSIADLGPWPSYDRVFFLGQVADLEPLYAAAKVVILPVLEGAGSPIKTYEALSRGKPLVATSTAIRGHGSDHLGLSICDDPQAFAGAVVDLLGSRASRLKSARNSLRAARRLCDFGEYTRLMNSVLQEVLGDEALHATDTAVSSESLPALVEWTPELHAVNRLLRSWIDDDKWDDVDLGRLSEASPEVVEELARSVSSALMKTREAPVIRSERRVSSSVRNFRSAGLEEFLNLLRLAMPGLRKLCSNRAVKRVLCVNGDFEIRIKAVGGRSLGESPSVLFGGERLSPSFKSSNPNAGCRWVLDRTEQTRGLRTLELSADEGAFEDLDWTVAYVIGWNSRIFKGRVLGPRWKPSGEFARVDGGAREQINVPLVGGVTGQSWIELEFVGPATHIKVAGQGLRGTKWRESSSGSRIARFPITDRSQSVFGLAVIEISNESSLSLVLRVIRSAWSSGVSEQALLPTDGEITAARDSTIRVISFA